VLLFQDIAAIPLIALVPFLGAAGGEGGSGWLGAGKAIAAIVGVVIIGRFLTRPLMRLIAKSEVREIFTAFALLLVIGIAQLMAGAGLSMALGAFPGRRAAGQFRIPARPGKRHRAVQRAAARAVLHRRGHVDRLRPGDRAARPAGGAGRRSAGGQGDDAGADRAAPEVPHSERWLFAALLAQAGEFAFVVFGVARAAQVLPRDWEGLLTAAVALSMAATPLLLIAFDRLTARRARTQRAADAIDDDSAPVIIAGMGRYGRSSAACCWRRASTSRCSTTTRTRSIPCASSATRSSMAMRRGSICWRRQARRKAKLLVVAIDDVADSLALVDLARATFPKLEIVARARNVRHWLELADRGVTAIERETFESSLKSARTALTVLGVEPYEARSIAEAFRRQNMITLNALLPHFRDEAKTVAIAKSGREELEENLRRDREARQQTSAGGWH
jgi:glutathione-regulated potassium-efflux system ancillary protein KefC